MWEPEAKYCVSIMREEVVVVSDDQLTEKAQGGSNQCLSTSASDRPRTPAPAPSVRLPSSVTTAAAAFLSNCDIVTMMVLVLVTLRPLQNTWEGARLGSNFYIKYYITQN